VRVITFCNLILDLTSSINCDFIFILTDFPPAGMRACVRACVRAMGEEAKFYYFNYN